MDGSTFSGRTPSIRAHISALSDAPPPMLASYVPSSNLQSPITSRRSVDLHFGISQSVYLLGENGPDCLQTGGSFTHTSLPGRRKKIPDALTAQVTRYSFSLSSL